jgi:hypothetical protein
MGATVSLGMIESFRFAAEVPGVPTAVLMANALATRVRWEVPFEVADASRLGGEWAPLVRQVLDAPEVAHEMLIAETARAGLVAVHAAYSADGLLVVSVIADPAVAQSDVHAAAHDVAVMVARAGSQRVLIAPSTATRQSLFELPLGQGHAWTITEREVDSSKKRERYQAVLPAWAVNSDVDLLGSKRPLGFADAVAALAALCNPEFGAVAMSVRQVARARFDALGFEAAAITAVMALGASLHRARMMQRTAELRFNRPYAVVAVAVDRGTQREHVPAGWHGVPVFSAWVNEPIESRREAAVSFGAADRSHVPGS